MKAGTVTGSVYGRCVEKELEKCQKEGASGAAKQKACACFSYMPGDFPAVAASVYSGEGCGRYAVCAAANRGAVDMRALQGISLSLLLPSGTEEAQLRQIVREAKEAALEAGTDLFDPDVHVTAAVYVPTAIAQAVGVRNREERTGSGSGLQIVMTKWAGLEGTAILAQRCGQQLAQRYPAYLIEEAGSFSRYLSVAKETGIARRSGAGPVQEVAEGGVFGALWKIAERAKSGLRVELKAIPIRQETVEICNCLDVNPYCLLGNGSLLCLTRDGEALTEALSAEGVAATVIGCTTDGRDRVVENGEEQRFLEPGRPDEIYRIFPDGL